MIKELLFILSLTYSIQFCMSLGNSSIFVINCCWVPCILQLSQKKKFSFVGVQKCFMTKYFIFKCIIQWYPAEVIWINRRKRYQEKKKAFLSSVTVAIGFFFTSKQLNMYKRCLKTWELKLYRMNNEEARSCSSLFGENIHFTKLSLWTERQPKDGTIHWVSKDLWQEQLPYT